MVLTLLSNCAVDKPTKEGLADPLSEGPAPLRSLQQLLASPPAAVLAEKALALIGNMCNAAPLRQLLSGSRDIVTAVADMACAGGAASSTDAASSATSSSKPVVGLGASGLSAPKRAASSSSSSSSPSSFSAKLATPAATALYNLSLDPPTAEVLATSGRVADLCKALASSSSCGSGCGATLHAARLAGCLSRVAKQPEAAKQMLDAGALSLMLKLVVAAVQAKAAQPGTPVAAVSAAAGAASSSSAGGEGAAEAAPLLLDACVRAVTIFTTGSPAAVVDQLVKEGGVAALLGVLRAFGGAEGVLGNASLCLANVASQKQHLPALQVADAVAPLVKVAYEGKGNVASKNAAIALARLAQQPAMLERLRELHGVEIIYQYVKPT